MSEVTKTIKSINRSILNKKIQKQTLNKNALEPEHENKFADIKVRRKKDQDNPAIASRP